MKEEYKFKPSIKIQHFLIFSIIVSFLFFNKANKNSLNFIPQETESQKTIFSIRELYTRILTFEEDTEKICNKSDTNLREYYETADKSKIGLSGNRTSKNSTYTTALINLISSEGETMDNVKTYVMHLIPVLFFFVFAILCIPLWILCCFCCCCNCCCCCCCKKPCCRFPCCIIVLALDALVIAACIYGLAKSNRVFVGIANTECSLLKFVEEIDSGETRQSKPRWIGINGIIDLLDSLSNELQKITGDTVNKLELKKTNISNAKTHFETAKGESCDYVNDGSHVTTKQFSATTTDGKIVNSAKLWLSVYEMFGKCSSLNISAETDENTFSYWLDTEYKTVSEQSEEYLQTALDNFQKISGDNEVTKIFDDAKSTINDIQSTISSTRDSFTGYITDYSDLIDDYGKLGFKIVFAALAGIDIVVAALFIVYFIFGTTCCLNCRCCRCLNKCFIHIFWNIMYLLMILTFIIGSLFSIIGTVGNDLISVVSYLIGDENLSKEQPLLIGSVANYLDICFNGNGSLSSMLGLGTDGATSSIDTLNGLSSQIDNVTEEFRQNLQTSIALQKYQILVNETKEYQNERVALVIQDGDYTTYEYSFMVKELGNKNCLVSTISTPKTCTNAAANDYCTSNCDVFKWMTDSVSGLSNSDSDAESLDSSLAKLKKKYDTFLEAEIDSLSVFKETITNLTQVLNEFIGDGDAFSFLNCTFIGTDIDILLKYLGEALGSNIYTVGKFLLVAGCSMFLSISFTILEVIIINKAVDEKIKEDERNNQVPEYPLESEQLKIVRYKMS